MRALAEEWRKLTLADVHDEGTWNRRCVDPLPGEVLDLQAWVRRGLQQLPVASASARKVRTWVWTHEREEAAVEVRPNALVGCEVVEWRVLDDFRPVRCRAVRLVEAPHDLTREPECFREQADELVAQLLCLHEIAQECVFESWEQLFVWPLMFTPSALHVIRLWNTHLRRAPEA